MILQRGQRTVKIIDPVQHQGGIGRQVIAAPGAAFRRIAFKQVIAAALRERERIVVEIGGFKIWLQPSFRVGLRYVFASPTKGDTQCGDRAPWTIMAGDAIAQAFPAREYQFSRGHGQEAFGQRAFRSGVGRQQRAEARDRRGDSSLTQPVLDRTAEVFFVQSIDDDGGHTHFPDLAERPLCAAMVYLWLRNPAKCLPAAWAAWELPTGLRVNQHMEYTPRLPQVARLLP